MWIPIFCFDYSFFGDGELVLACLLAGKGRGMMLCFMMGSDREG